MPDTPPVSDAARVAEIRDILPTSLGSAEIRGMIAEDVRSRSVFSARTANAVYLTKIKEVIDAVANGEMDKATARVILMETLRALDYTPEGGFPDDPPGEIPPAIAGTLQDLGSKRRLDLIIDTQLALMSGRGWQLRGMEPARMEQFPAWELVRTRDRTAPRNWQAGDGGTPPKHRNTPDLRSRWTIAGGQLYDGRMIALKGDPVWGELGSSGNFDDALDTDHPPFAWQSGMGWREIDRAECAALGVTGPDGESPREWQAAEPRVIATPPPPKASSKGIDPAIMRRIIEERGWTEKDGAVSLAPAAPAGESSGDRLARAIARRQAEYAARPK
jgi:hypothetical protein